ncbi:hypothetical protein Clacol_008423 [Clathrus columnatus]|uniref:Integral membrane protein n=1 Tax=Clathrus columnatus TaxID=1419009 RepID=A0AAV5AKZ4_9AGAM|nr:hypothetical protein Clacol_008423 [Clathrus columnatus]
MPVDNPHLTIEGIKAIDLTFPIAAFVSTLSRLFIKHRIGNFWWDDGVAVLATLFCGLMSSTNFIHYMNPADISADFLLIGIPIRLLSQTALPRGIKIRVLIIFGAASLITVVSLIHAAYILAVRGIEANLTGIVEISVAVMVSNVIVILPAIWRICGVLDDGSESTVGTVKLTSMHFATSGNQVTALETTNLRTDPTETYHSSGDFLHIRQRNSSFDDAKKVNLHLEHVHEVELDHDSDGAFPSVVCKGD